jgi:hypothetical protein
LRRINGGRGSGERNGKREGVVEGGRVGRIDAAYEWWWWVAYDAVWRESTGEVEECAVQSSIYTAF